jgi:hypothetical protein
MLAGMPPSVSWTIPVIDFRRQSMALQWNARDGTWSAYDTPPALVHGAALIRAGQPGACLFARDDRLHIQVGAEQCPLGDSLPRILWSRDRASFGLRRTLIVESGAGEPLFQHSYWTSQGDEFFAWLSSRTADPEWRKATARRWSEGVQPAALRAS